MSKFKSGDKVRCINGDGRDVITGNIYTVNEAGLPSYAGAPALSVMEYPKATGGWFEWRFELVEHASASMIKLSILGKEIAVEDARRLLTELSELLD